MQEELNCFCQAEDQQSTSKQSCMIDCNALHILHYQCILNWIKTGKRECPFDRNPITKCLKKGQIKKFPKPRQRDRGEEPGDYPCYICHSSCRPGYDFDQVVVCSRCDCIFCHPSCVEERDNVTFDMSVYWYCPECVRVREENRARRRNQAI